MIHQILGIGERQKCNTSYPHGHFAVVSILRTGGWHAQRNQGRIEGKAQATYLPGKEILKRTSSERESIPPFLYYIEIRECKTLLTYSMVYITICKI